MSEEIIVRQCAPTLAGIKKDLNSDSARELLKSAGYECNNCGRCIVHLMKRLCESCEFPHEIGLFLSYPPEDVKGFIENHAANFKCAGLWKVYGDEKKALKLFRRYKHCTNVYCSLLAKGRGIEDLAICS